MSEPTDTSRESLFGSPSVPAQLDDLLRERLAGTERRMRALDRRASLIEARVSTIDATLSEVAQITRETAAVTRDVRDALIAGRVLSRLLKWAAAVAGGAVALYAAWKTGTVGK